MTSSIKLIVGLGNPGPQHALDRHNVGFWFADALVQRCDGRFGSESKFHGDLARIQLRKHDLRVLKPTTYMNNSGQSVAAICHFFKIEPSEVLVVHDELDLPAGTVKLKRGGGHGGHNGLRSLIAHIGAEFLRIRLGVGHPGHREAVVGHVLQRASRSDEERILDAMADALDVLPYLLSQGEQKAMHRLHSKAKKEKAEQAKAAAAAKAEKQKDQARTDAAGEQVSGNAAGPADGASGQARRDPNTPPPVPRNNCDSPEDS